VELNVVTQRRPSTISAMRTLPSVPCPCRPAMTEHWLASGWFWLTFLIRRHLPQGVAGRHGAQRMRLDQTDQGLGRVSPTAHREAETAKAHRG